MNSRHCLRIADRIDVLLQARLGRGIDLQRMLGDPLYRRDVLLVCDAHRGDELAELALRFREASVAAEAVAEGPASSASDWGSPTSSGIASSQFDTSRPSQPESSSLPPDDAAASGPLQRRARAWHALARWRR
ncbi:MAG: hypothetical protein KGL78_13385 [Burkholderiales bacterium]|nr:hypothetical protein [Burkholderiales bacterium]